MALERRFRDRRAALLKRREEIQHALDLGARPDFLPEMRPVLVAYFEACNTLGWSLFKAENSIKTVFHNR